MEDTIGLYYFPEYNYFIDEFGCIVYDIFSYISPNVLFLFHKHKDYMLVTGVDGELVEMFYQENDDEED